MLLSNIYEITPKAPIFSAQVVPYSNEIRDELREKHNASYSFFRSGDELLCIWMEGDSVDIGKERMITWDDSPEICQGVAKHLLFRTFIRNLPGLKPLDFSPLRFLSRREEHDLIRGALPEELKGVATCCRLNELNVRKLTKGKASAIGVTINIDQFWGLSLNAAEMHTKGFNLKGRLVSELKTIPGLESLLAPEESIIGEVQSIDGNVVLVSDMGKIKEVDANRIQLRRSPYDILDYIEHVAGTKTKHEVERLWRNTPPLSSNPHELLSEQTAIARYLADWTFETKSGLAFEVSKNPMKCEDQLSIQPTVFRFDPSPGATNERPASGLFKHGPYDARRFTPKNPNILIICDPSCRAGFSSFAHALENGVPESRYFKRGLKDLYSLQNFNWVFLECPINNSKELDQAIRTHLQSARADYHLALLQGDDAEAPIADSPYYTAKSTLMAAGIPVQAVQPERTRLTGDYLGNILGNLALQVYAKMGGTPWTVESSGSVDHEIVIGVGHNLERTPEGKSNRLVGITTVFSSDGTFLISRTTNAVEYENYFDALLDELSQSIEALSEEYAWNEGASVRIVFHVFKPMKMVEVDVVRSLIERFSQFNILFAFVTIALDHPFRLYDTSQGNQRGGRQVNAPDRLANAVIDRNAALVHLRGSTQRLVAKHGYPRASLVRIHPSSTFTDLHYIVQQVVDFSQLSWRSFFPSYIPVTVQYSNLIAEMLQRLSKISGWNPACLSGPLRRKKWFL